MAAPFVTGTAALMFQTNPELRAHEAGLCLETSTLRRSGVNSIDVRRAVDCASAARGCYVSAGIGPSCQAIRDALAAITVQFADPPFFDPAYDFGSGPTPAVGYTPGWTVTGNAIFPDLVVPPGYEIWVDVSVGYRSTSEPTGYTWPAMSAHQVGDRLEPLPSGPGTGMGHSSVTRHGTTWRSNRIEMSVWVCPEGWSSCASRRAASRPVKASENWSYTD